MNEELRKEASNRARVLLAQLDAMAARGQTAGRVHLVADALLSFGSRLTPREADDLPACLCPADGVSFHCPIHGAVATGRGLR